MKQEMTTEVTKQILAAGSITGAILTWWPLIFAIPGAIYYCILIAEKLSGKPASEWFTEFVENEKDDVAR